MKGGIFGPFDALAAVYGGYIGFQRKPDAPTSIDQATKRANIANLAGRIGTDITIGFADDLVILAGSAYASRYIPGIRKYSQKLLRSVGTVGWAVAGGFSARDYQDYVAAQQYLAASQRAIPDRRINPIDGFQNAGAGAANRIRTTGIASPAAGGILYRLNNNPAANFLNQALTRPDEKQSSDPRIKAMAYSTIGAIAGVGAFSQHGLGRSTLAGLGFGFAAGLYGIYQSHNPSFQNNLNAVKDIALVSAPTLLLGTGLYALASGKGAIGAVTRNAMARTISAIGRGGDRLQQFSPKMRKAAAKAGLAVAEYGEGLMGYAQSITRAQDIAERGFLNINPLGDFDTNMASKVHYYNRSKSAGFGGLTGIGMNVLAIGGKVVRKQVLKGAAYGMYGAGRGIMGIGTMGSFFTGEFLGKMMSETPKATNLWEQSVGLAHVVGFIPHHIIMAGMGANIYEEDRHRHAILASNGGR